MRSGIAIISPISNSISIPIDFFFSEVFICKAVYIVWYEVIVGVLSGKNSSGYCVLHFMGKKQKFKTSSLLDTTALQHKLLLELNGLVKKGRTVGHCFILQASNNKVYTKRYLAVSELIKKDILRLDGLPRMNLRGYTFSSSFRKWQKKWSS